MQDTQLRRTASRGADQAIDMQLFAARMRDAGLDPAFVEEAQRLADEASALSQALDALGTAEMAKAQIDRRGVGPTFKRPNQELAAWLASTLNVHGINSPHYDHLRGQKNSRVSAGTDNNAA